MSAEGNFWYVKLPDGDVHRITLDELDAAYQSGHIDENTMVLAAGSDQWTKLGDLAGGDEDTDVGHGIDHSGQSARHHEAPTRARVAAAPPPVVPAVKPGAAASAAPYQQPATATPSRAAAPVLKAPPAYAPFATSLRPLSVDLTDAGDLEYPKPRRGRWVVATAAALVAVGGVGFAVQRTALSSQSSPETAAAAAMQLPPAAPPPAPDPAPTVSPVAPEVVSAQHLPDDLKSKLLDADKQREAKSKLHKGHPGGESHAAASPKYKASPVFTTGGNKYDPLNSNL